MDTIGKRTNIDTEEIRTIMDLEAGQKNKCSEFLSFVEEGNVLPMTTGTAVAQA